MRRGVGECLYRAALFLSALLCASTLLCLAIWLFAASLPVLRETGAAHFLTGLVWRPENGQYGVLAMAICTACLAFGAALLTAFAGLGAACFLQAFCHPVAARLILRGALLLSGLPSVLYGLLGMTCVAPVVAKRFEGAAGSGGACLLSALLVLTAMLLPTMTLSCMEAISASDERLLRASDALGATKTQTVFGCLIPAIRTPRRSFFGAALRRAAGEATAVLLVSGNVVRPPALFAAARPLAGTLVLEMGYASGAHRSALFAIGLLLLLLTAALPIGGKEA